MTGDDAADLEALRERIRRLDADLVAKTAERIALGREIGAIKHRQGLGAADYAQESIVLQRARDAAAAHAVDPALAEEIVARLIRASLLAQEEDRLKLTALGAGRRAVVVGGAGRMGRWMRRFLSAQGYAAAPLDPQADPADDAAGRRDVATADLVVCAAPPAAIASLYLDWAAAPPQGIVVDIASIKTPLVEPITRLRRAGGRVASIHPMFGPATLLLRDADVVVCDTGDDAAREAIERLFEPTTARLVRLPLEDHDRVMADLLSLAHAAAIAFALALPEEGHQVRSTTFQALERLAAAVVRESPEVYYEIQARNPHSAASIARLRDALDRIVAASAAGDPSPFRALFEAGRARTDPKSS
ncbi:MAG TPA: prephenate dehydrogenase/arogenate dehydrogenase family protein [Candidatus Polarisedimenticolia bacterium]|nr:prephenate dehydrogenase/arogenate dehydrogenase family protein [Candidatus Polarisedimenticolia bacterium]